MATQHDLLRNLPKVDECIKRLDQFVEPETPPAIVKLAVQRCIEEQRRRILAGEVVDELSDIAWIQLFRTEIEKQKRPNFRRVINGTGVVIHTNLGRSLLSRKAAEALMQAGAHYSNLEFSLDTGKRGSRYSLVEKIICDLTGAEAALVVNNNAAAVLLVLETLARGTEVIVSRGQLVEIGGSFRIPDVMAKSGARLIEVGATNRTHLFDYERAITPETSMLLKVHTSNFRIIGFTAELSAEEMVQLAHKHGVLVMEDLGSGCLVDLSRFGLPREPTVQEIVKAGVDVVTFSGDKLLGGPQAGIIVGKRDVIERVKKNPLNRALRIDKFTLSSLEIILREYFDPIAALQNIPTLAMLTISADKIKKRAQALLRRTSKDIADRCVLSLMSTVSRVGGGAMPEYNLPSWAVALQPQDMSLNAVETDFRQLPVPLIGRIENDKFIMDMRTIQENEIAMVADILVGYFGKGPVL
ncbi:L-seryl-tRNA(Sec) selenium transferase [Desulfoprunum benzoelyticum]|uniref:L-seryl-tRNA(Sec) selenium transferase n=1 Tax=Desulfoprunum benzoelyticum TaxID=1506996 RepID=A0A840V3J4_9BACT|nr:L-seryl-tRNA(Sec) selenium transferase [Desulfoprunum benzoelyticum]MBB5349388.1 L-seryl-tRNA(Ser) seleniumtransferase [Desulfoprunum benzoelyticum]MBM9531038.1 L-seryl-tRNA(Sec) selenium transferase [Desulfoprunum benzoelyticum]